MTEYELNAFHSEFDPVQAAESLQKDSSREAKVKVFAVLKTSYFLGFTRGEGRIGIINDKRAAPSSPFYQPGGAGQMAL